jgi:hypothetical protein
MLIIEFREAREAGSKPANGFGIKRAALFQNRLGFFAQELQIEMDGWTGLFGHSTTSV